MKTIILSLLLSSSTYAATAQQVIKDLKSDVAICITDNEHTAFNEAFARGYDSLGALVKGDRLLSCKYKVSDVIKYEQYLYAIYSN